MAHGSFLVEFGTVDVPLLGTQTFGITSSMTTMVGITILLGGVAFFASRNMKPVPGKLQNFVEFVVDGLRNFFAEIIGYDKATQYLPLLGSLFLFILISNYSGILPMAGHLPGLAPPTGILSTTVALAIVVFFSTHVLGFKVHGGHYFGHFLKPIALMLPLTILEELIRPLSLSLRLYGNIYGEETIAYEIFKMVPLFAPIPLFALSILFGFIQALVFTMLAAIYIDGSTGSGH